MMWAMPLPHALGRFNAKVSNHVMGPVARVVPGFGVVGHVGRRTGRRYRTPVNVFAHGRGYVIALTYGAHALWVGNVLAAGECELETRLRRVRLCAPRLVRDPGRRMVPLPVRAALALLQVDDFLTLEPCPPASTVGPMPT